MSEEKKEPSTIVEKTPSKTDGAADYNAEPSTGRLAKKKKIKRSLPKARVCIHAGENNTIVTFTDLDGYVLGWSSSGSAGFKGTRKSTPYAAKIAAETATEKVRPYNIETITVEVKGLGPGREQAIRGLQGAGMNIDAIIDVTPIPHGGCRAPGRRRV